MTRASSTKHPRPQVTTLDLPKPKGAWFDAEAADRAVKFFSMLPHIKGKWAGQPFILEPWQEHELVRPLFGWKRKDGMRLYRECYVEVPRKQGKSTVSAGIAGVLTYADGEPGAECYSAAVDRDQAAIVFDTLSKMVAASPELSRRSEIYRRSIVVPKTFASYKVLSGDTGNKDGLNASGVVIDELHAHPTRELYDVLATSMGSRTQPLLVSITTAGTWSPDSICWEKHEWTRKVATRQASDSGFLGLIYAADESDDPFAVSTWRKANPGYGTTLNPDYLKREAQKAKDNVAALNTFLRLHLNIWTQQVTRWLDLAQWDASAGSVLEPDLLSERRMAYAGLDLGSVSDLTAWAMVFPGPHECHEDCVKVLLRCFCPETALQRGPNADLYRQWARQGYIDVTPGSATDYAFVKERVMTDASRARIERVNLDALFQGGQLGGELQDEGLPIEGMRQGHLSFAAPMRTFAELLAEGKLHHGGNPVLRWMADNVVVKSDPAGNIKPDKAKSNGKIDGIVAVVMALEPMTRAPEVPWAAAL